MTAMAMAKVKSANVDKIYGAATKKNKQIRGESIKKGV
jgi:hypothetical protein